MKIRKAALAVLLLMAVIIPLSAESIAVINRTGYDIYYLQISSSDSDDWGDDILGDDVLMDGDSIMVSTDDFSTCELDVMATDEDGDEYVIWGHNSCEKGKLVITIDDLYVEDGDSAIQDFTIANDTGYDIYYIYISPGYSDDWEEDILGEDEILYAGETYDVTFSGYGDQCDFDVRLVDEEGDTYTKYGVDLCSTYTLSISLDDLDY